MLDRGISCFGLLLSCLLLHGLGKYPLKVNRRHLQRRKTTPNHQTVEGFAHVGEKRIGAHDAEHLMTLLLIDALNSEDARVLNLHNESHMLIVAPQSPSPTTLPRDGHLQGCLP